MKARFFSIALIYTAMLGFFACSPDTTYNSPSPILTSTEIVVAKTATPTSPVVASSSTPASGCVSVVEQALENLPALGNIVLSGAPYYSGAPLSTPSYLLNLSSGEKIALPLKKNEVIVDWSFSVSPNREFLEYAQANINQSEPLAETLHIVTAHGVEKKTISSDIDQRGSIWIDNNTLLVENLRKDWSAPQTKAMLLLLNTNTGERTELFNDYPNQWNGDDLFWEFNLSRVIYNPDLTRAVYPTFVEPDRVIRMIDAATKEILIDIPTTDYGKFPMWAPDGKRMAFVTQTNKEADKDSIQDEIFVLSKDGDLVQLTHFSQVNIYSYITGLSWSADSQYSAFFVNNTAWEKGRNGVHLAVVDTYTGETRDYCEIENPAGLRYIPWGSPIWSPDGNYILVNLEDPNDEQHILITVVEVSTRKAFVVAENFRGVGWLK